MTLQEALDHLDHERPRFGDQGSSDAVYLLGLYTELRRRCNVYRAGKPIPQKFTEQIMAADTDHLEVLLGIGWAHPARRGVNNTWQGIFDAARMDECSSPESGSGATASA